MKTGGIIALAICLTWTTIAAAQPPPVTATQDDSRIVLDNGLIRLIFARDNGQIVSLKKLEADQAYELGSGRETTYWDCNTEPLVAPQGITPPNKGYWRPSRPSCELIESTPDRAEVRVLAGPDDWCLFAVELRYTLFRGDSGFYQCAVMTHPAELPAARLWQTRFVAKVATDDTFDTHIIDDERIMPIPKAQAVEQLMDATYRLEDGTIKTKYANSVYWAETPVYGIAGKKFGVWSIAASNESQNGGPVKQGQTVHDNVLLRVMQSVHFGASPVQVEAGQQWQKVYGPFFTYVNSGSSVTEMWADAKKRQREEVAKWPYQWVNIDAYGKSRGSVSGQWKLTTGQATQGAWVILAYSGVDWALQANGYQFWTRSGPDGKFTIPNVLPGRYTLYISGADQPEDFAQNDVVVVAGQTTDLDTIEWQPPTHGRTIWQIGTFDRSAAEFRNGDDSRHYEMFRRYPEQFPDDVTFAVGKSDPRRDWNYAHWVWYSRKPVWTIQFDLPNKPAGTAMLTIGFASAQPLRGKTTNLQVAVNGHQVDVIHLPKTGTAGYRGGVQDSQYNLRRISFDASLLTVGKNTITLGHAEAMPFPDLQKSVEFQVGQVMYDAIRLELAP